MGLTASMWAGVSGLLNHGEKMNVVGNNLANVSTVGFKAQRMDFEDYIYQDSFSSGGLTQVGLGSGINAITGDFSQGSFEATNSATDLAIGGDGYFAVRDEYTNEIYYTRAGNFSFDYEGYLRLPSGETLQGWAIDNSSSTSIGTGYSSSSSSSSTIQASGAVTDIVLNTWTVSPSQTTKVDLTLNLTADSGYDNTTNALTPMFSMAELWDGTQDTPLSSDSYAYQTSVVVYDEGGTSHTLTTYFDQISSTSVTDLPSGYTMYEYIVTMDPSEDARTYGGTYDPVTGTITGESSFSDTTSAGLLMTGTLIFNASGELVDQTAYTYMGNTEFSDNEIAMMDPTLDEAWQPTAVSTDGYPVFSANFSGYPLGSSVRQSSSNSFSSAESCLIEFDLGLQCTGDVTDPWGIGAPVAYDATNLNYSVSMADAQVSSATYAYSAAYDDIKDSSGNTITGNYILPSGTSISLSGATYTLADGTSEDLSKYLDNGGTSPLTSDLTITLAGDFEYKDADGNTQTGLAGETITLPAGTAIVADSSAGTASCTLTTALDTNFDGAALVIPANTEIDLTGATLTYGTYTGLVEDYDGAVLPDGATVTLAEDLTYTDSNGITQTIPAGTTITLEGSYSRTASYDDTYGFAMSETQASATTSLGGSSVTQSTIQDGYTSGDLSNIYVDSDGILYGIYSNGITLPLYQISLYDFVSEQGLQREGGNLFSATIDSGNPQVAAANTGGMGSISSYQLEQSNVDMTVEFVQMIATQRGFQANSKIVSTVDTMLSEVIAMKR